MESVMSLKEAKRIQGLTAEQLQWTEDEVERIRIDLKDDPSGPLEFSWLSLPESFERLTDEELADERIKDTFIPPFAQVMWRDQEHNIRIVGGKVAMDPDRVYGMTEYEFREELRHIGQIYGEHYQKTYGTQASLKVRDSGPGIVVSVTGKYVKGDEWHTERRLFYIYTASHRLTFLIWSRDETYTEVKKAVNESLARFEKKLGHVYPDGIDFKS